MKYLSLTLTLLLGTTLSAQYSFKEHYFQRNKEVNGTKHYLELYGNYEINSDYLSNKFISSFYAGDFIDTDLKTVTQSRLKNQNTIGVEIAGGINYKLALDSLNLVFSIGQKTQSSNSFSKNLYNLYLFGNKPYAGTTLNLSTTDVSIQSYRYYALGLEKKLRNNIMLGGKIKLYEGRFFYDALLERASFFTEIDGSKITIDPKLELSFMTERTKFNPGVGLDFFAIKRVKDAMVFFEVEDLGFINYRDTKNYSVDSTYEFTGLKIESIFALDEEEFDVSRDDIDGVFGVDSVLKNKTRMTPARFTIGFQEVVSNLLLLEAYVNYRLLPHYSPQVIFKPNFFLYKNLSVAPVVNLGGFGRLDLGLNISYHDSRFFTTLDILEFENIIKPDKTSGRGMFLKAGLLF